MIPVIMSNEIKLSEMTFPKDWQNCPPSDAEACYGSYFRVGRGNPPTADDFRSQAELGRAVGGDECLRAGLSTLRDLNEANHLVQLNSRLGSVIYKGDLIAAHGKSKLTSSRKSPSHTTWWPFADIDRAGLFSMVEV